MFTKAFVVIVKLLRNIWGILVLSPNLNIIQHHKLKYDWCKYRGIHEEGSEDVVLEICLQMDW